MKKILTLLMMIIIAAGLSAQTCTLTSMLHLCKPTPGTYGWQTGINSNFDLLDSFLGQGVLLPTLNVATLGVTQSATVPTMANGDNSTHAASTAFVMANGAGGGYSVYFSNQTASSNDARKLTVLNCASACTYTLPNPAPSASWYTTVLAFGTAPVSFASTQTMNGTTSALSTNMVAVIYALGTTGGYAIYQTAAPYGLFNTQTTDYTVLPGDNNSFILMDCTVACNLTLPASITVPNWHVRVLNTATLDSNTVGIAGGYSGPLTLYPGQSADIYVDGTGTQFYGFGSGNTDVTGVLTLTAGAVSSNTCQSAVQSSVLSSLLAYGAIVDWSYVAPSMGTADSLLKVNVWYDGSKVNAVRCNTTSASQTGTALTINWKVTH